MIDKEFEEIIKSLNNMKPAKTAKLGLRHRAMLFCYKVPVLKIFLIKKFNLNLRVINYLVSIKKYDDLYDFIILLLKADYYQHQDRQDNWWHLMRLIVTHMQEQQIYTFKINPQIEEELIHLSEKLSLQIKSYDVSYCYVGFSLWLFERSQVISAREMVEIAAEAYPTWGYPDYLLGWYGLFLGSTNTIDHFRNAINKDWSFLQKIKQDKTCQQFPNLIKEVTNKMIVGKDA